MPGAYAHITLVNEASEPVFLEERAVPFAAINALGKKLGYAELGAVSPDYPYLALGDRASKEWADAMHYVRTGKMIHAGIHFLREFRGQDRDKGLAWLLGYTAHVVTDVTIHPVVEMKVGPYHGHEKAHRICEMHQDAYIYQRMNLGGIQRAEHLDSGISRCCRSANRDELDEVIAAMWARMIEEVHPAEFASNRPDFNKWLKGFRFAVDKVAEEGGRLWPIARHVAIDVLGLAYPPEGDIDRAKYIDGLDTPLGKKDYDTVFDEAKENVAELWRYVASGVLEGTEDYLVKVGDWDLDTGKDDGGRLAFWAPDEGREALA